MRTLTPLALGTVVILGVSAGCGDDITDPLTNAITCQDVCERYEDCLDEDYDVSSCRSRCEDAATDDEAWEDRLESCEACLDDRSCASAAVDCASECSGIVP